MEEFKKRIEPILEEHLTLDRKCEEDHYYDFDAYERDMIWGKEKEALSGVKFEDVIAYLDTIDSAEKLGALSEGFYDNIANEVYGNKRQEVLECFKRNNKRLGADLDEFLEAMETHNWDYKEE